jgi:putative ABC transport system permease protein
MAWRDSRAQRKRLILFAISSVFGMAGLVAIHSLEATVEDAVEVQAKALLGADLHIASRQPIPADLLAKITAPAARTSREISFASMLTFPSGSRMVSVRGVEGEFPFYGKVETAPAEAWPQLHAGPGVLLEPALLDQFGVKPGDRVRLGQLELPILGTMVKPPPRSSRFGGLSPEVYVRFADLPRTGLLGTRSLASYDLFLELRSAGAAQRIKRDYAAQPWRFETPANRREALEKALHDLEQFLGLIAQVALILAAVGVAGAVHAHVTRRVPAVAILRCLGCPAGVAFAVYLAQALVLGILGAILGALLGAALHCLAIAFFQGVLPVTLRVVPPWRVLAQTTAAGFTVCAAFSLLPLLKIKRVPPIAALRETSSSSSSSPSPSRWLVYALLAGLLLTLSLATSENRLRALSLNAGLAVAFAALAGTARLAMWLTRRLVRREWPYLLRQGISNLYRPRNQTLLFLLSLGLGAFLLLTTLLTRNLILQKLTLTDLAQSPNLYLIDVQADQREGVAQLIRAQGLPVLETAPMVTMRISAVRGVPVQEVQRKKEIPRWILQREFRSPYRAALSPTEKIVAGQWVPRITDPNAPVPLSLEKEIAKDLKVGVGDELTLDVQGAPIRARIASLREVDWSRFNLNFFMVFPPGVLEDAPGFFVHTTRLPAGATSGALQRALVQKFPNVTAIDLTAILETVRSILAKIIRAVSLVAAFTVLAGLPILAGTLINGREQRLRESVLLRTLGASSRQVGLILATEYAALGLLSGFTAVVLAAAANAGLAWFIFKTSPAPSLPLLAGTFIATTLVSFVAGMLLSRGLTRYPPLEILRRTA